MWKWRAGWVEERLVPRGLNQIGGYCQNHANLGPKHLINTIKAIPTERGHGHSVQVFDGKESYSTNIQIKNKLSSVLQDR